MRAVIQPSLVTFTSNEFVEPNVMLGSTHGRPHGLRLIEIDQLRRRDSARVKNSTKLKSNAVDCFHLQMVTFCAQRSFKSASQVLIICRQPLCIDYFGRVQLEKSQFKTTFRSCSTEHGD